MRKTFYIIICIFALILVRCVDRTEQNIFPYKDLKLPDNKVYSEIIREIILQDTFTFPKNFLGDEYFSSDLLKFKLRKLGRILDSVDAPQSYPDFRTTIAELNWYIADSTDLDADSVYFSFQNTGINQLALDGNIVDLIKLATKEIKEKNKREKYFAYYQFSIPMLNKSLTKAFVRGDVVCNNCGHGEVYCLEKKNNKWILTFSRTVWQN